MTEEALPLPSTRPRDYRLDFFRGLALFFIFIDHIPNNPFGYFTMRGVNLADAAEVFIFISGYTAALVYGAKMRRQGAILASALIWRRAWQLYVAHLCLFMIYSAEIAYTLRRFNAALFSDELGFGDFLQRPDLTIPRVMLLRFQPALLDILPLYIALLLVFPVFMIAMRRNVWLALIPSALIYAFARLTEVNLPGNTDADAWFFDPLRLAVPVCDRSLRWICPRRRPFVAATIRLAGRVIDWDGARGYRWRLGDPAFLDSACDQPPNPQPVVPDVVSPRQDFAAIAAAAQYSCACGACRVVRARKRPFHDQPDRLACGFVRPAFVACLLSEHSVIPARKHPDHVCQQRVRDVGRGQSWWCGPNGRFGVVDRLV